LHKDKVKGHLKIKMQEENEAHIGKNGPVEEKRKRKNKGFRCGGYSI